MNNPLINPGLGTFFWMLVSFGVLVFILGKWGWPMLLKALNKREKAIADAAAYDGFYAVYTSLDADKYPVSKINRINHGRWEIEECFRILKSEFEARPVYLQRDNRIKAHFLVCYIALTILRVLEVKTDRRIPYTKLITCLSEMDFVKLPGTGYIPAYTRDDITDALHKIFGFRTDRTLLSHSNMKKIFALTKKA